MDGFNVHGAIGGTEMCRKLSAAFYARVDRDPVLRPLFPGKSLRCAVEAFAAFLVQFLGGPPEDAQFRWWLSLRESHSRFKIGPKERKAWMSNMIHALDDVELEPSARMALRDFFERASAYVVNAGQKPQVEEDGEGSDGGGIERELSWRWSAQRDLDQAVAAIQNGESRRAIELAEGPALQAYFKSSPSVFAALLGQMIQRGDSALLDYVRARLLADRKLVEARYSNRTLLHSAAAAGCLTMVELLLELGADAKDAKNAKDAGGHTPLYCVGNECQLRGGDVIRALVRAGADVNFQDGAKRCTALHMAARRGSVEIAEALLDCGADIEIQDSLGDTALRRAVNCNKSDMAKLLLARGADPRSKGNKGLTPLQAARSEEMKRLLRASTARAVR